MLRAKLDALRETLQREEVKSISRRYFISNGFDGTLTSIGITVGSFLSGVEAGMTVVTVGIGAAIGLSTSGVWSVWEIEKAEKLSDLKKKEDAMFRDLKDSELMERMKEARVVNALMSGLGPLIGILGPVSPFVFAGVFYSMLVATVLSVLIGVLILFIFGAYMGKVSRRTWYVAGARMGLAGLFVAAINIMLPG
ncbi:MAG: VIT1/CCC1 transporter family protein [Candidatus Nanohaloarchaea archaeon]|nr:VIT1/CCC1 transporter family protein [Candidatus Nanohaloarchaea archaeon]